MEITIALKAIFGVLLFGSISYVCFRQFFRIETPKFWNGVGFAIGVYFALCTLLLPAYFIHLQEQDKPTIFPPFDLRYLAAVVWAQLHNTIIFTTADAAEFEATVATTLNNELVELTTTFACSGRHAVSIGKLIDVHYFRSIRTMSGGVAEVDLGNDKWAGFRLAASNHCPHLVDQSKRMAYLMIDKNWAIARDQKLSLSLLDRSAGLTNIDLAISGESDGDADASIRFVRMVPVREVFAWSQFSPFRRHANTFPRVLHPRIEALVEARRPNVRREHELRDRAKVDAWLQTIPRHN